MGLTDELKRSEQTFDRNMAPGRAGGRSEGRKRGSLGGHTRHHAQRAGGSVSVKGGGASVGNVETRYRNQRKSDPGYKAAGNLTERRCDVGPNALYVTMNLAVGRGDLEAKCWGVGCFPLAAHSEL